MSGRSSFTKVHRGAPAIKTVDVGVEFAGRPFKTAIKLEHILGRFRGYDKLVASMKAQEAGGKSADAAEKVLAQMTALPAKDNNENAKHVEDREKASEAAANPKSDDNAHGTQESKGEEVQPGAAGSKDLNTAPSPTGEEKRDQDGEDSFLAAAEAEAASNLLLFARHQRV